MFIVYTNVFTSITLLPWLLTLKQTGFFLMSSCSNICTLFDHDPLENAISVLFIYTRILTNSNLWPWPLTLKIEMVLHYILVSSVWSLRKLRHKITCTKTAAVLVPQGGTKSFEEDFGYLVSIRFCSCIKTWRGVIQSDPFGSCWKP